MIMRLSAWFQKFVKLNRRSIACLNRIIAIHTCLKDHLNRINLVDSHLCPECEVYKTIDHVVFSCPNYELYRPRLLQNVQSSISTSVSVRDCIAVAVSSPSVDALITNFLRQSDLKVWLTTQILVSMATLWYLTQEAYKKKMMARMLTSTESCSGILVN